MGGCQIVTTANPAYLTPDKILDKEAAVGV
jgi:hypothetical protein